jgi:hypothetical protein
MVAVDQRHRTHAAQARGGVVAAVAVKMCGTVEV